VLQGRLRDEQTSRQRGTHKHINVKTFLGRDSTGKDYQYQGDFEYGMFHGKGLLETTVYSYNGSFKEGVKEGHGQLQLSNCEQYVGQFVNDVMEGQGSYVYRDGSSYEGQFR
jgi:hypothetical protein